MGPSTDTQSAADVAEFVQRLRPEPRKAFLTLRALVVNLGPDVVERVTPGGVHYLRRETPFLRVEAVRTRLRGAFPATIQHEDALGRLLKRGEERTFRLDRPDDLDAHIQEFVRKAYTFSR